MNTYYVDIKKVCCIISKFKIMTFQLNGDFLCRFMDKVFKGFSQAYYPKGERKKKWNMWVCVNLWQLILLLSIFLLLHSTWFSGASQIVQKRSNFFGKINLDIQFKVQPAVKHIYDILLDRYFIHNSNSLKDEEKACKE